MPLSPQQPHRWDVDGAQALAIQEELAGKVIREGNPDPVRYIAGVDMSASGVARAAVVLLTYPELELVEVARAEKPLDFPYIPGLLSFREGPAVLAAFEKLRGEPDLIMFDGQGIAHPRRLGIAAHIGVLLDKPTIGVAKSRLTGHGPEPGPEKGDWSEMHDKGELIAYALRSKKNSKPLYISSGHRISLPTALDWVIKCLRGYRLPEPTRQAHNNAAVADG